MSVFYHPFAPIFDEHSRLLILGSFPSKKSRADGFYYAHLQNRFWKVIAALTCAKIVPGTCEDKQKMLLQHGVALWDIVQSCSIQGSSDHKITQAIPVDLSIILENAPIKKIFANGDKAYKICQRNSIDAVRLPSTSPANAAYTFEKLLQAWQVILE